MADQPGARWFDCLPAAEAAVPCGTGTHAVRWEAGRLTLPAHPDAEAELVLGALGGEKPGCVTLTETWARHADDLAVLAVGPRCAADLVSVDWAEAAALRANLPAGAVQVIAASGAPGPAATGGAFVRAVSGPRRLGGGGTASRAGWAAALGGPGGQGVAEMIRRQVALIEVQELLALGPRLQFRLAGTVAAAWAAPGRADERARHVPEFCAALTGRLAPAAQEWLGIDPDAVTVTPYEGPGWGTLEAAGTGQGRRLRASLPAGWLADVWACGLAVAGGHLVVAIEEPGYPAARVLALPAPDAEPVVIGVRAADDGAAGPPRWELAGG